MALVFGDTPKGGLEPCTEASLRQAIGNDNIYLYNIYNMSRATLHLTPRGLSGTPAGQSTPPDPPPPPPLHLVGQLESSMCQWIRA